MPATKNRVTRIMSKKQNSKMSNEDVREFFEGRPSESMFNHLTFMKPQMTDYQVKMVLEIIKEQMKKEDGLLSSMMRAA